MRSARAAHLRHGQADRRVRPLLLHPRLHHEGQLHQAVPVGRVGGTSPGMHRSEHLTAFVLSDEHL